MKHPAEVAALASVVRGVVDDLTARGHALLEPASAAMALVERWLAGEAVTAEALEQARAAAHQDGVPFAAREKDRAREWANTAVGNLAWLAAKPRGWKGEVHTIMDAALYARTTLGDDATTVQAELDRLRATASLTATPKPPRRSAPQPRPLAADLTPFIGAVAQRYLGRLAPRVDPTQRADDAALGPRLAAHGLPLHRAVVDFDARYGGLTFTDAPRDESTRWLCGAYACAISDAHHAPGAPRAVRVPVVYAPNDVIYLLDGDGAAWAIDTIEDLEPAPYATSGDVMLARILVRHLAFARTSTGLGVEWPDARGTTVATALDLAPIAEASDALERVWGDDKVSLIERRAGPTVLTSTSKRALAALTKRAGA